MSKTKHAGKNRKHTLRGILICILLLAMLVAGGMMSIHAYFTDSDSVTNNFTVGNNTIEIETEGNVCAVRNTGSVPCYIRVFVGTETGAAPDIVGGSEWVKGDGTTGDSDYYYYTKPLAAEGKGTEEMPETTTALAANTTGLIFYAESIQSETFGSPQEAFKKQTNQTN